jgi:hypothetical protein
MNLRRSGLFVAVAMAALLAFPAVGLGAIRGRIVENVGIKTTKTAKLGMRDSTAASKIGGSYKRLKDASYDTLVWVYRFGKKSGGKYGLEMYSKSNRAVFEFVINCNTLTTKNGTRVGTGEITLNNRYGSKLKKSVGPVYTDYWMGTRAGRTDFYVKDGRVKQIVISRY